jgi:hypothetical protein
MHFQYGDVFKTEDGTVSRPQTDTGLYYLPHQAIMQVYLNKQSPKYKALNLRVVVGSLGLGIGPEKPFYEYGGDHYTTIRQFTRDGTMDMHAWLEDEKGQIYDIHFYWWDTLASFRIKRVTSTLTKDNNVEEWCAMDKSILAERGYHYLAAPESIHDLLLRCAIKVQMGVVKEEISS